MTAILRRERQPANHVGAIALDPPYTSDVDELRPLPGGTVPVHVQTKREIEELLARRGLRPRKKFGQHFLIDGNQMRLLVESADLNPADVVLEVGAGTGGLTDLLADRATKVIAVEIDHRLFDILAERFASRGNVTLILGDALERKHRLMPALREWLRHAPANVKLVANLPYDVATPLLMNLLLDFPSVTRFCFTVQTEVAERIVAPPGVKAYGPLGIIVRTLCSVGVVAKLGPQSFWPRPLVDSTMLRLDRRVPPVLAGESLARFAALVHGVFEHRRKTLRSALGYVVDDDGRDRICKWLDPSSRPERIAPEQWLDALRALAGLPC